MKGKNTTVGNTRGLLRYSTIASTAIIGMAIALPGVAQTDSGTGLRSGATIEEVMVTARRKEENLQDVPIAISVYSQDDLDKVNITSGADLAIYNPSLTANNRFGSDAASFAIRGFTQELRTTASVGTFFAEVVAPRSSGLIAGGDGAGPGYFFDLQNVQILKGPQGTLFGRNTTGGALLLSPQKPTDILEGYIEVGGGNYDMKRAQGAISIPITDKVRTRFAADTQKREGYLDNVSGVGPDHLADVDYVTARASLVIDLTDSLENYTIYSYTHSENNGVVAPLFACNSREAEGTVGLLAAACQEQLQVQGDDFYTVMSLDPDPVSRNEQSQIINTTTWDLSSDLTVKNILSYADVKQTISGTVFGTAWLADPNDPDSRFPFTGTVPISGVPSNSQTSFIEELQFQGSAFDGDMTWQAGLYYENNKPDGPSGTVSPFFAGCSPKPGDDPNNFNCFDGIRIFLHYLNLADGNSGSSGPVANIQRGLAKVEYTSKAIYGETTYTFNDKFAATLGLRYTDDETEAESQTIVYRDFPPSPPVDTIPDVYNGEPITYGPATDNECVANGATLENGCRFDLENGSDAVTGHITFNYYPTEEVMTYAKYSRGYRQASLNPLMASGLQTYDDETVDAYEIGAKSNFEGPLPGSLNVAIFYNELTDQQIQQNVVSTTNQLVSTTAILNAGESVISGVELEAKLQFPWQMFMNFSYTYLDTELKEYGGLTDEDILSFQNGYNQIKDTVVEGGDLTFSPEHSVTVSLNQQIPVPIEWGDMSLGMIYVYTDEQLSTANSPVYGNMPQFELWNFNYSWTAIAGSGFDIFLFVTNAKDEEVTNYVNGLYDVTGNEYRIVGQPRMYGAKLRYTFD